MFLIITEIYLFLFRTHVNYGLDMKYVIGHFVSGNLIVVTKRCFTILVKCYNVTKNNICISL